MFIQLLPAILTSLGLLVGSYLLSYYFDKKNQKKEQTKERINFEIQSIEERIKTINLDIQSIKERKQLTLASFYALTEAALAQNQPELIKDAADATYNFIEAADKAIKKLEEEKSNL